MILLLLTFLGSTSAHAHQPVVLLDSDTTAAKGPLLLDGTNAFKAQHENQGRPAMNLAQYLLGPLTP
jgi:hypothetical protein